MNEPTTIGKATKKNPMSKLLLCSSPIWYVHTNIKFSLYLHLSFEFYIKSLIVLELLRDCYIRYFFFHHSCVKFIIAIGLIQNSNLVVTWPAACINIICFIRSSVRNLIDLRWTFENTKMCFAPWRLLFAGSSRWRIHRISVYHETKNKKDDWAMIIIWRKRFFFFFVLLICNQL